ncbi:hypothetical protein BE21_22480 [Sorangium cellulosum]|uniref:Uncharacterized protein n=1 Tax=Sorangium cellulosum TaxID=56 RepID=A0A150TVE6_SORCE|nr:hypothetical protein BE21_22480 [Sorangium cellulosum]
MSLTSTSRRLGRATAAILFIGLASCRPGGTKACTEAACSDHLEIQFEPELVATGRYHFMIDLDGVTRRCSASLPGPGHQELIDECSIRQGNGSLAGVTVYGVRPKVVALRVVRDQAVLMDTRVAPFYDVERPNGPDCPPECSVARVTVGIKEPAPGVQR